MNVTQPQMMSALYSWLSSRAPDFKIVWADYRRQDRPKKPLLLLSQLTGPSMDGHDEAVYLDTKRILKGDRTTVISLLFYPEEKKTYDGIESVRIIQDMLADPVANQSLYIQGIVVDTVGNLLNLTDADDIKYGFDLTLRLSAHREDEFSTVADITTHIEVE